MLTAQEGLKKYFGYDCFLDNQKQVVDNVLEGGDWCVVMPTGAGKSLCYQLPILMRPGYGIVVSPLISLMKDQVDALVARGIPAELVNSTVEFNEQLQIFDRVKAGKVKLLYVAPERFRAGSFRKMLRQCPPDVMIVDEAHCISQWGHDFRPSYLALGEISAEFGIRQVCAFTATATPRVREDITLQLRRPGMKFAIAGFKRPNLAFRVEDCPTPEHKKKLLKQILAVKKPTIIYASTRRLVDELSQEFGCIAYHAGLDDEARSRAQERFMTEKCPILAATNAFGMGIDRPDVRRVIHYTLTGSLEAYYQEAGRAGRDGEMAECILFFSYADRFVQEFLIDMNNPPVELIRNLWTVLRRRAAAVDDNVVEMTGRELAEAVPGAKNETQIGSALRSLEKAGYVEREIRNEDSPGKLRFLKPLEKIHADLGARITQRSIFIDRCFEQFGDGIFSGVGASYGDLETITGLNNDQLRRVLRALSGENVEWRPPFTGLATRLLLPDDKDLSKVDFEAIAAKRDFELGRLEEVMTYTRAPGCRQRFLIEYFGEPANDWQCDACDHCHGLEDWRDATRRELEIAKVILEVTAGFRGRIGRNKLCLLLTGGRKLETVSSRLVEHPRFGSLDMLKPRDVMQFLLALESQGLLETATESEFPCVDISDKGRAWLRRPGSLKVNFPPLTESAGRRSASGAEESINPGCDDLFEELRRARLEMARARGVPAFQILPDAALKLLANAAPVTATEAMQLRGIGPAKAATVLPKLLEVIREWRKRNALSGK